MLRARKVNLSRSDRVTAVDEGHFALWSRHLMIAPCGNACSTPA
jgi:hypothetical protein